MHCSFEHMCNPASVWCYEGSQGFSLNIRSGCGKGVSMPFSLNMLHITAVIWLFVWTPSSKGPRSAKRNCGNFRQILLTKPAMAVLSGRFHNRDDFFQPFQHQIQVRTVRDNCILFHPPVACQKKSNGSIGRRSNCLLAPTPALHHR